MNPFTVLDDLLSDWASPRARRTVHRLLLLGAIIVGIFLAADGNWGEFIAALAVALYAGANSANTSPGLEDHLSERDVDTFHGGTGESQ